MFNFIFPVIAMLGEKLGNSFDKISFNKKYITASNQMFLVFIAMFLGSIALTIFQKNVWNGYTLEIGLFFFVIIIISFFQNIFQFHGISKTELQAREPIVNLHPIITSFIAYICFPSEREIKIVGAILLSILILYIFNFKKNIQISFNKGILYIFGGVLCSAVLANIYKYLLDYVEPELLLTFRSAGILLLLILSGQVVLSKKNFGNKSLKLGILSGIFYFIGHLAKLYSIQELGLNLTILLLFLGPVVIFLFSFFILKEKVNIRNIISSCLILLVVIGTIFTSITYSRYFYLYLIENQLK